MLASISPLGERARGSRWSVTVVAHVVGSIAGGALVAGALGAFGSVVPLSSRWRGGLLAGVIAAALVVELAPNVRLPTLHRQVDEDWLRRYRGWVYGFGYGFQLGMGVVTIVTTAALYAALAAAFLSGSLASGALIGVAFGATRGAVVLTNRNAHDAGRLRELHRRVQRWERPAWRVGVSAQALALAAVAGTLMVGGHP
ncbi:MAG: hypothetical protein QOG03_1879 [Actinomycetota bacterium]|jgi:sulfite exporter TauE/SafE|nr:hypothetical protein [Actinomycetota bacterium]